MKIELNEQFRYILDILENTSKNIFITGRAGTGKSTLLEYFREHTKKKVVVLAPTGVAAVNVRGQTIHSFFRFGLDITPSKIKKLPPNRDYSKIYRKIEIIIIDEVSMVRADILDCVDKFLRLNGRNKNLPFGGTQMILIGDLYQLPPVTTYSEDKLFKEHYESPYFFSAKVFEKNPAKIPFCMEFTELEKVYRQKDKDFINLLNSIRNNTIIEKELHLINQRFNPDFKIADDSFYIYLTTTNNLSSEINETKLDKVKGKLYHYYGRIFGNFNNEALPTEIDLRLKIGAQVMLLNNDSKGRWVNGTIGKIVKIEKDPNFNGDIIWVELTTGEIESVLPYTWKLFHYEFNSRSGVIETEEMGSFTQYPLKLAWSVTIHKSQGKTFDKVIIDIGRGTFAHGQMYVAMSRCTSLEGIILKQPLQKKHIWMDWRVVKFITEYQYKQADERCSLDEKTGIIQDAIKNKTKLSIVYLKPDDTKSKRIILPKFLGDLEYQNKKFLGLEAFCFQRKEDRVFKLNRILEIKETD